MSGSHLLLLGRLYPRVLLEAELGNRDIPHLELLDLAHHGHRVLIDELYVARDLEGTVLLHQREVA